MNRYVVDTSAYARRRKPSVAERLGPLRDAGLLATCRVLDLEMLFSARSGDEHRAVRDDRATIFGQLQITDRVYDRALDVQGLLAARGQHRGVAVVDLVVAACAELHDHSVLHYDAHFDRIAELTGQPTEWVVPRGSAD